MNGKGVTIPSQIRYVDYFRQTVEQYGQGGVIPAPPTIQLVCRRPTNPHTIPRQLRVE